MKEKSEVIRKFLRFFHISDFRLPTSDFFSRIVQRVAIVHGLLLGWICIDGWLHFSAPPRPIAVHQVRRPTPAPIVAAATAPVAVKKSAPAPAKKVVEPKKKAAPAASKQKKVTKAAVAPREEIQLPALISARPAAVEIDIPETPLEFVVGYDEQLALFLESALMLPEQGEVEAELCVKPNGELLSYRILSSKSKKNEEFLRKKLPNLFYPCFNEASNINVTVVFRNADLGPSSLSPAAHR